MSVYSVPNIVPGILRKVGHVANTAQLLPGLPQIFETWGKNIQSPCPLLHRLCFCLPTHSCVQAPSTCSSPLHFPQTSTLKLAVSSEDRPGKDSLLGLEIKGLNGGNTGASSIGSIV